MVLLLVLGLLGFLPRNAYCWTLRRGWVLGGGAGSGAAPTDLQCLRASCWGALYLLRRSWQPGTLYSAPQLCCPCLPPRSQAPRVHNLTLWDLLI